MRSDLNEPEAACGAQNLQKPEDGGRKAEGGGRRSEDGGREKAEKLKAEKLKAES
jgi:hypothetical protein